MNMTPKQIIYELDKYIIGQDDAKRSVAVALRNRYRRSMLPDNIREEITPKNIIMKGPTGVGKTEISRRLAKLVKAPFIKVEATKFTEVGYVGRDVESMIRDLAEVSVRLVKEERMKEVELKARDIAEQRLADILVKGKKANKTETPENLEKAQILEKLRRGELDNTEINIDMIVKPKPLDMSQGMAMEINIQDIMGNLGGMFGKPTKTRTMTVKNALNQLVVEESEKLLDVESVNDEAIRRAENEGIIFIDEIDKIASSGRQGGPDVSREGVQRDILPIVEGSTVQTKYGAIKTDFILFIASGAFHISKVEDLIPELQGRFPIFVELSSLNHQDFIRILSETENAITLQYANLLSVDNIQLKFTQDAISEIAAIAVAENETSENIGARRLHSIMEALLEDISFNACGGHEDIEVVIDKSYVDSHLGKTIKKHDLKRFIL